MEKDLLLGIDVGTTATKVLAADENGRVLASASAYYPLLFPCVGWAEQEPEALLSGVKRAVKEVVGALGKDAGRIAALSLSTQRDTMVMVDGENRPLRNAITWMDSRASDECEAMKEALGEEKVYRITGVPISTIWTGAFILWLRKHEPENWERAACFGLVHDYLMCAMGAGEHVLDTSNACETMMFDFVKGGWDEEILHYMGLTADRLPRLVEPGTVIGHVSAEIAQETGLDEEVLLVAGGGDQQCAMLGSGAIRPGDGEVGIGTAANIMAASPAPQWDEERKLICHRSLVPGGFLMEGAMLSTGKLIEWLKELFYAHDPENFYQRMDEEVEAASRPGAGGLLITPHFEGAASPHWNPDARGFAMGLTLSTTRADICRAVLEGIALEIKKSLELMKGMGTQLNRMVVSGGAANSPVWLQIIADVLQLDTVVLQNKQCAAVGSLILAGVGCGLFATVEQGTQKMVAIKKTYAPRRELAALYEELLAQNMDCYGALDSRELYARNIRLKQRCGKEKA